MHNPYEENFPGAGPIPQANPSDAGETGVGTDSLGTQVRDWTRPLKLARITSHESANVYGYAEVYQSTRAGHYTTFTGNSHNSGSNGSPAFEANERDDVPLGTNVVLFPNFGAAPGWTFVYQGATVAQSGSGGHEGDLNTIHFDAMSDVTGSVDIEVDATCVDGVISITATATLNLTKTWERVLVTGRDLSVFVQCDTGGPCQ